MQPKILNRLCFYGFYLMELTRKKNKLEEMCLLELIALSKNDPVSCESSAIML